MNNQDVGLDQLFALARNQAPETSYEDTKKRFLGSLVIAAGGVLATKGIIHLFTKKWIIMMTIVTLATSAAIVAATGSFGEKKDSETKNVVPVTAENPEENTPVTEEDELEEKTYHALPLKREQPEDVSFINREIKTIPVISDFPALNLSHMSLGPKDTTHKDKNKHVKIVPYQERFIVTQNTTIEELDKIQKEAENAGIKLSYEAEYKNDKLDHLKINMSLAYSDGERNSNMNESRDITDISKKDQIVIAWLENEDGKAVIIGSQKDWDCNFHFDDSGMQYHNYMKDFERSMKDFEESMRDFEQMNFAFALDSGMYAIAIDCGNWANDFEFVMPEMPEIPMVDLELELEQLEQLMEELEEMNEENLKELEEELKALEEKIKEMQEEIKRHKEAIEKEEKENNNE